MQEFLAKTRNSKDSLPHSTTAISLLTEFSAIKKRVKTLKDKTIKRLRCGDLLVIKSIDRLGRNYDCILREWKRITKEIGADIYVLDMPLLDTRCHEKNLVGKLIADMVLQLLSFVAENERINIRTRQAEGIKAAKARGVKFGRPKTACPENFREIAENYKQHKIDLAEALSLTKMKISSFYRYFNAYITCTK